MFDLFEDFADGADAFGAFEFLVGDFHVDVDTVEEVPVSLEVLRQTVALAVPLLGEEAVRGLDVLDGEEDGGGDGGGGGAFAFWGVEGEWRGGFGFEGWCGLGGGVQSWEGGGVD